MKKKIINIFLILTILISIFPVSIVNANSVNRIETSKVGTIVMAYTGGNSQVYVNKITKQDGTVVRYVYSSNFIVTPSTIAKLKSVLASEYSSLIPDDYSRADNVGIMVCSDPSLVNSMNENWTSSEWVGRNVVATGSVKSVTNEAGNGINQTAISNAQSLTVLFNEIKTDAEAENRAKYEAREQERKASWDAAEAEKKEADPNYIPQEYVHWEYVPLDFGTINETDIQNVKALENNQVAVSVGTQIATTYSFEEAKLVEVSNFTIINHVASIYTEHTNIDDSETTSTNEGSMEFKNVEYIILEGADQTYTDGENLIVKASGDLDKLQMLKVDGTDLSPEDYILKPGSTIATLKSSYLSTLDAGTHILTFIYNDGSVDTTFTIPTSKNTINNPPTGDNIMFYISMLGLSIIGLAGIGFYVRKKKFN